MLRRLWDRFIDWYDRQHWLVRESIDQAAHFFLIGGIPGAVVAALFSLFAGVLASSAAGGIAGAGVMGLYEWIQNHGDEDNDYADLRRDLAFGFAGAFTIAALVARLAG